MTLWRAFLDGGSVDYLDLLLSLVALAIASAAAVKARAPIGRALGAVAAGVGVAILLFATLGAWRGRSVADAATDSGAIAPGLRDRVRREGYAESNKAIDFGLGFAAIPLLLGGAVLVAATRRDRRSVALPAATLGAAGVLAIVDVLTVLRPLPGRDLPTGDPAWHLVDASGAVTECSAPGGHCSAADWEHACGSLDTALHPEPGSTFYGVPQVPPDLTKLPDIDVPKLLEVCRAHPAKCPAVWHGRSPMLVNQPSCPDGYVAWKTAGGGQSMCSLTCGSDLDCCGGPGFKCKAGACKMGP
jgi:hypothetical protein